nr:hypothetical protein [Tanacetum cinerariifolium]
SSFIVLGDLCEDGIVKVKDFNQELGQTYSATHWTYREGIRIHKVEGVVCGGCDTDACGGGAELNEA